MVSIREVLDNHLKSSTRCSQQSLQSVYITFVHCFFVWLVEIVKINSLKGILVLDSVIINKAYNFD